MSFRKFKLIWLEFGPGVGANQAVFRIRNRFRKDPSFLQTLKTRTSFAEPIHFGRSWCEGPGPALPRIKQKKFWMKPILFVCSSFQHWLKAN